MVDSTPTPQKVEIAQALIKRAIEISETTPHDVFVEWCPHTNDLTVSIHRRGWKNNKKASNLEICFDSPTNDIDGTFEDVTAVLDSLEGNN